MKLAIAAALALLASGCVTSSQMAGRNDTARGASEPGGFRNPYLPEFNNPGAITSDSRPRSN